MELRTSHIEAGHPLSTADKLRELLDSEDLETRIRLAENQASPPDVLRKLAKETDPEIRASVANNPATTHNTIRSLSTDSHDDVRFAMASNPRLPYAVLREFCEDQNPFIRDRAYKTVDGIALEMDLEQQGFISFPGTQARLGELLTASGVISEKEIECMVISATSAKMPLGRALVQAGRVMRSIIVYALKQQTLIRLGQVSLEKAIEAISEFNQRQQYLR